MQWCVYRISWMGPNVCCPHNGGLTCFFYGETKTTTKQNCIFWSRGPPFSGGTGPRVQSHPGTLGQSATELGISARTITESPELVCSSSPPAARSCKCINPDAQRAALATFPTADHIQTVPVDVQSASRSGSGLPGATLRSGLIRRGPSSSEVSFLWSTRRAANIQENIRRQGIRKLRAPYHGTVCPAWWETTVFRYRSTPSETFEFNSPVLTSCFCRHWIRDLTQTSFPVHGA